MKAPCPACASFTIREGASKCPACKAWVRPKPRPPPSALVVLSASFGLIGAGAVAGAMGAYVALARTSAAPMAPVAPVTSGSAATAPSGSASGRPAPPPSGASSAAPASAAKPHAPFGAPRSVKLEFAPVDAVLSDDGATLFTLADDGSVHALAAADGHEVRKVTVVGRASELRLFSAGRLALLGGVGPLQIVDTATWAVHKLDVGGGPIDAVEVGDAGSLVVASSTRRLTRFSSAFKAEGHVTLSRGIVGLSLLEGGPKHPLGVVELGRRGVLAGAIELFDPVATPFAGARSTILVGFELRRGVARERGDAFFLADRATGQLIEIGGDRPMRAATVGKAPFGAYRLGDRWVVTLDAGGSVAVSDSRAERLDPQKTFALGGAVSDAAVSPDGKALIVALGGGARERGAMSAVVGGDPPALLAKYATGAGSHAASVSASGKAAVVCAYWARSIAILDASP